MTDRERTEPHRDESIRHPLAGQLATSALRIALYAAIALSVIGYGAVDGPVFLIATFAVFCVWLLASATIEIPPYLTRPHAAINWAIAGVLAFTGLQVLPILGGPWGAELLPPQFAPSTRHAISIDPSTTIASTLSTIAPLAAMSASLLLHQNEIKSARFMRRGALLGSLIIGLSLIQSMVTPDMLLLGPKLHYRDSFTATFVNRNTAATFCGLVAVVALVFALNEIAGKERRHSQRSLLVARSAWSGPALWLALSVAAVGLALTKSRAGVSATLLPILAIVMLHGYETVRIRRLTLGLTARIAIIAIAALAGGSLLLDQVLVRFETQGADSGRWCVYATMLSAASEKPWLGIGLGGFQTFYSLRRDPACGIYGAWEYLHSTYLEILVSGGIVLLLFVLGGIAWLGRLFFIGYRERRSFRSVPLAAGSALALISLHSIFDFSVQIPGIALLVGTLLGAAIPVSARGRRSRIEAEPDNRERADARLV